MPKLIDETGNRYGRLLVIKRAPNKGKATCWECRCDCGNITIARANDLRSGRTNSCGCLHKELLSQRQTKPIPIGTRFHYLTVIEQLNEQDKHRNILYKCKCDCGNITIVPGTSLRSGNTKSCGCFSIEQLIKRNKERSQQLVKQSTLLFDEQPIGLADDLRGQQFGKLTVLYRVAPPKPLDKGVYWKCQCECGNTIIVKGNSLTQHHTKSCGCLVSPDEIGNKYGRLTVIDKAPPKDNRTMWRCRCDCGNECIVAGKSLRTGSTQSCGCLQKDKASEANLKPLLPGQRFGKLVVLRREGMDKHHHATYLCKCDCGNTTIANRPALINGYKKSCGCIKSFGEQKIQQLLENFQINFVKEKTFEQCISDKEIKLRFDFYINQNYLIEYDGIQHFQPSFGQEAYELTLKHDEIKNEYCKSHNIPLIRIPYWHYDKITINDLRPETSRFLI